MSEEWAITEDEFARLCEEPEHDRRYEDGEELPETDWAFEPEDW